MKRFLLILILSIAGIPCIRAQQEIKFRHLSLNQGLSQSTITSILKDKKGYMWFGTRDGLNRYDGYNFVVYKSKTNNLKSITNNYITDIIEDKKGNIWVGTPIGLDRFDRENDSFIHYSFGKSSIHVRDIFEDSKGNLWIGTSTGLYFFDPINKRFNVFTHQDGNPNSIFNNTVNQIAEDQQNHLWILTKNGLNRYDPVTKKIRCYLNDPADPTTVAGNNFRALFVDSKNNVWIGCRGAGISIYNRNNDTFTNFRADPLNPTKLSDNNVTSFMEADDGRIWIGTESAGVNILDLQTKTFTTYKNDPLDVWTLTESQVNSLYIDYLGTIWVGNWEGGINYIPTYGTKFVHFRNIPTSPNCLSNNSIKGITSDPDGNWWIATKLGGVNVYNPKTKTFSYFRHSTNDSNSIVTDYVHAISCINKDTIAIGYHNKGLDFYNRVTGKFSHIEPTKTTEPGKMVGRSVNCIIQDSYKDIWIGTWGGGLNQYNKATNYFTVHENLPENPSSISNSVIFSIYEDKAKQIWAGTENGLNRFDRKNKKFIRYSRNDADTTSLCHNTVYVIFQDSKRRLWVGTGGGLSLYQPKSDNFISFTEDQGLPSNSIQGILEDSHGNLWLSTFNGIAKFDPDTKKCTKIYTVADGLQGKEFNMNAYMKTSDGVMLFGGGNGLNSFHPDSLLDNPFVPPIVITDIQIFNKPVPLGEEGSPLKKHISETKEITLSYDQSVISLSYAALNYSLTGKNIYSYKLKGFDKDWNNVGSKRTATYTNLDPGVYTFIVKGTNNDGLWNEKGTSLKIIITPPFWQTWIFKILVSIILSASAFFWYRSRISAVKKRQEILEEQVKERTAEILMQKEEMQTQAENLQSANEEINILYSEIKDSIRAAQVIQKSILPSDSFIKKHLPESFVLFKPKDVVSGDFYWFDETKDKIIIAAADCTGHGVSGAFMSINAHHLLNQAIYPYNDLVASEVLARLNEGVIKELHQQDEHSETKDGMDIALCIIDKDLKKLQYAGAQSPLYILRGEELIQVKGDRYPIGLLVKDKINSFTNHELSLQKGDIVYLFSDGYADQIGGEGEEKLMYPRFREMLLKIGHEDMDKQSKILDDNITKWRRGYEQLDDILVIGFRV